MKTTEMGKTYLHRLIQSEGRVASLRGIRAEAQTCVVSPSGRLHGAIFIRTPSGDIFASHTVDLFRPHRASDDERRAWCRVAGVSMADLRRVMRTIRERDKLVQKKLDVSRLRNAAARHGYKLVPA